MAHGPEGIDGFVETFVRITAAGVMVGAYFRRAQLAISSFTPAEASPAPPS